MCVVVCFVGAVLCDAGWCVKDCVMLCGLFFRFVMLGVFVCVCLMCLCVLCDVSCAVI